MHWFYGVAGLALLLIGLWRWAKRPVYRRGVPVSGLQQSIDSFLVQMGPGSVLLAKREDGQGFLQLALRSATAQWQVVEFGLPDAEWSAKSFEAVATRLRQHGYGPAIEPGETPAVRQFIRVSLSGHTGELGLRAHQLLQLVSDGLGWSRTSTFAVHCRGGLRRARGSMPVRASAGPAA